MKYWISLQLLLADGVYCVVQIPDQLLARLGNKETRWLLNVPWPLVACRVRRRGRRRRHRSFPSVCPSDLPLDREAECDGVRDPPLCRGRWHHTHTVHVLSIQPVSTVNIWTQRFSGSYRWTLNSVSHITLDSLPKAWGSDPLINRAGVNIRPAGQN